MKPVINVVDDARFEVELEFVQCLSDVYYLKYLSDEGYFKDERFRAYILYLQYWRTHEYIKKSIFLTRIVVYTHSSSISGKFGFGRCVRNLHELIDDTNYKLKNKFAKYNKKLLLDNLNWLNQTNNLSPAGPEFSELLCKLENFNFVEKLNDNYDVETLSIYLTSKLNVIQSLIPYIQILNTMQQDDSVLRLKYEIINNDLVQYLYRIILINVSSLGSELLLNYLNFLLEIGINDVNHLILKLYPSIINSLDRENYTDDERLTIKLKLSSNLVDKVDLNNMINELLVDSLSSPTVFYNCFNEILHLTHSVQGIDTDYVYNFINKVSNYVYILGNNELLRLLYVLLKKNWVDDNLFGRVVQSLVYKFESLSNEQMETLITLLCSYKQYFKLNCMDLGENLYSECGNMLINMVKRTFEEKFVNLSINLALSPLTYLLQLTNSNRIKVLMLKKLDKNAVSQLGIPEFHQLLIVLRRLNLVKNREAITQLIENYVNSRILPLFNTTDVKLLRIDDNMKNILMMLSDFIKIKHYAKYFNSIINNYFENIGYTDEEQVDEMIFLINLCIKNKVYKFSNLTGELVLKLFSKSGNFITLPITPNILNGYDIILDGIEHCNLTYECVSDISSKVFDEIYTNLRGKSKINLKLVSKLLGFSSNIRIFQEPLTKHILQYVKDNVISQSQLNSGLVNVLVLYLKCSNLLKIEVEKLDHIYSNIISGLECVNNFNTIVEELGILLLLLKYDNFGVYSSVMSKLHPELREKLIESRQIIKPNRGKLYKNLENYVMNELKLEDVKNYYKVEELTFDFYSPKTNEAIHLLKSNRYMLKGDEIHLKYKAYCFEEICKNLGINLRFIPEHFFTNNLLPNYSTQLFISIYSNKLIILLLQMVRAQYSDVSSFEDEEFSEMSEFRREQLLAEKHAKEVKLKQRRSLLRENSKLEQEDSIDLYEDFDFLDEILDETVEDSQKSDKLFDDDNLDSEIASKTGKSDTKVGKSDKLSQDEDKEDKPTVKAMTVEISNSAKLSKSRTLNILEHPSCNEYLSGALINLFVSVENLELSPLKSSVKHFKAKPIGDCFPRIISKHVVFQIESAVPCEPYDVFGNNFNSCDHSSKVFMSKCSYLLCGRVLNISTEVFNTLVLVSVNDVCNSSFQEEQLNFGDEYFVEFLKQISNNLKSVLFPHLYIILGILFAFTDEDVQMILEQKLQERTSAPSGKMSLIAEIQRYTHEIELLTEAARNDPSNIMRLKEHEKQRQQLVDELKKLKDSNSSTPFSFKNYSILSTSDDLSIKTIIRKITKPTPMIMGIFHRVPNMRGDSIHIDLIENKNGYKRTLNDLNLSRQTHLINHYLQVTSQII
ncbi:uncharacterized protein TA18690 [Theileria annulata]|uniref:SOH1-like protein n=1 Tax=Theileria annulata TaxID=5874 RepID=Q4UBF0_THEAN|nr:uncharacterized protein TA18690 [Theileria annulata]CAI75851.1 hypothetical protein TA18690 [Theileria annulata]|eukprot:XP_955327.1 hypothetical protein TA18690 [Theileria annulata]